MRYYPTYCQDYGGNMPVPDRRLPVGGPAMPATAVVLLIAVDNVTVAGAPM